MKVTPIILILLLLPCASAAIAISFDAVCNGPDCVADIESDTAKGRTRIATEGPVAASQAINYATDIYNSTTLIDADQGKLQVKTPEINLRADARNLKGLAKVDYNTKQILGEPEIIEDEEGNPWLEIENRTLHYENARFQLTGNGSLHEEIIMAVGAKSRKAFDYSLDGGNFSLNQSIKLSGLELKTSFEMLDQEEHFDEASEEAAVKASLGKVLA